ncbi:uncharacterized protein LOC126847720 [Adelges cooleyi]|uniref:uncharacterized protein LOC126847720 n=1 Tax=Adelges cooleyi TaxID=133065 RepID=UPI0021806EFD|nr:uncharacterized protein LOC126847720 [Adelges cooleyi]
MHFKSALIVCAVYFLTSAWSIELNSDQLEELKKLYENCKKTTNGISKDEIAHVVKETFGIEWENLQTNFEYHSNLPDSVNLINLLWALAATDNQTIDKVKVNALISNEVSIFLEEFVAEAELHKQRGYINLQQLSEVFEHWKMVNDALNAKRKVLKTENPDDYVMNAVEFLLLMIEIKPEGYGLNQAQIEMFGNLYEAHKTSDGIDPVESEKVFNELGISINDELRQLFKSTGPAEVLLIDLIVAAAERNKATEENEWKLLSPSEVVFYVNQFNEIDDDNDGLVSLDEYADFMNMLEKVLANNLPEAIEKMQDYLKSFYSIKTINVVVHMEYVLFMTKHIFEYYVTLEEDDIVGDNSQA